MRVVLVLLTGMALLLSGCSTQADYRNVSAVDAEAMIAAGEVTIIDVREPGEYASGHIPGAQLIPLGSLADQLADLDLDQVYLLVCRSGNRSGQAAKLMVEYGFGQVNNLRGGMNAWQGTVDR